MNGKHAEQGVDGSLVVLAWCSCGWHRTRLTRKAGQRAIRNHLGDGRIDLQARDEKLRLQCLALLGQYREQYAGVISAGPPATGTDAPAPPTAPEPVEHEHRRAHRVVDEWHRNDRGSYVKLMDRIAAELASARRSPDADA